MTATLTIRKASREDEAALCRICLLTADAGNSAEHHHDYPELPGLVYSVPYVHLPTTWGFVLHDDITREVVAYIVGSSDTRAYEAYANEHWWPQLAEKYPPSIAKADKLGDVYYTKLLRNMDAGPQACIDVSPAHIHINILPAYQKQGWGRRLIAEAVKYLREEGLDGLWLGFDPRNTGAKAFYERLGFKVVEGTPSNNHLSLMFDDFH